ncbi:MAG: alpha/beta fold hydrolase [Kofleriaceae bacterium]
MRAVVTRASAALDRGVLRFMELRMTPRTPKFQPDDARTRLLDVARAYGSGTLGLPSTFFPAPRLPEVKLAPLGEGPLGTQVIDLSYASEYEPFFAPARAWHLSIRENATAHTRWWTSGRGRPTIVMLHGWGAGSHWVTARMFAVSYWLRHGFDVASVMLPFHGNRAPATSMINSAAMLSGPWPSPNPLITNEGFGQAIFDLRVLSQFLRDRGSPAVGAMGMSLGGYTTSLWASIAGPDDVGGIDFAVAMIPAVSMAHLMWRHGAHNPARARAVKAGITEDLLADAFAVHAPTTRPSRVPRERLAVIAGRGDRITPPDQAELLARHWGVDVQWFEGGHLAQIGRSEPMRRVRRQLGALGLVGREFRA